MTVDVQTPRAVYLYSQNVDYPVTFSYLEKEDVRVTVVDENSKETRLQQGVDWEFSDSQEVHLLNEYTTTDSIVIFRQTTPDQETAWEADVRIEPTILEYDFDKLTLLVQELLDDKSTTVRMPLDFTGDEPVLDPELLNKVILAADEARLSAEEAEASAEAAAISETYANSSAANAEVDANRAEAAADRAESAADLSEQYANNAEQSEINAGQSEANAEAAVSLAEDAAGGATASATAALDSENRAYQWAQNPEDVPVRENPDSSENEYSAYHWAKKAEVGNVPTATEVDEGVVRFGTAAEHAAGLNGVAAQPGRVRDMLFTGSTLKSSILPVATTAALGGVKPDGTTITVDGAGAISAKQQDRYELCEFYYFRHPVLRPGFQPAQGGIITDAATQYPEAWAYLKTAEGQRLCLTESEWQAMSTAYFYTLADGTKIGWNGIGGVPFLAPNMATGDLRMPDLRGMYMEAAGFDSLDVGSVHGDVERNKTGTLGFLLSFPGSGAFYISGETRLLAATGTYYTWREATMDTSRVVPVGNKNAPRAFGVLPCVYLGVPR